MLPINGTKNSVSFVSLGFAAGPTWSPSARLAMRAGAGGGMYIAFAKEGSVRNPYLEAGAEAQVRFSPTVAMAIGGRYKYCMLPEASLYNGVSAQIGVAYDLGGSRKGTEVRLQSELRDVFPLFYSWYDKNPFGKAIISNDEDLPIEKVKILFYAKQYMDSPRLCAEFASIPAGQARDVPVYGLFNDAIFRVTEGTKAAGEFQIEYFYLGKEKTKTVPVTLNVQNRNAMTWDDDRKAAAFITAKDPAVLGFAKGIAGMVRGETATTSVSMEFRISMAIFQSLKLYGLGYAVDPVTPYLQLSGDESAVDFLQFPSQTLVYRAGDCDDISVLYAALLESVGIEAALVTTPGHIFVAFNSGLSEIAARRIFGADNEYILEDGKIWIPVEITLVSQGFNKAWSTGGLEWGESASANTASFYPVRAAWELYEPVGFAEGGTLIAVPDQTKIRDSFLSELDKFSRSQITAKAAPLLAQIKSGKDVDKAMNRLGILYAQFGLMSEAREQFRAAIAKSNMVEAMVNLGNVEYLSGKLDAARVQYEKALKADGTNVNALVALARCLQSQGDIAGFRDVLSRLQAVDASAAARYFPSGTQSRESSAVTKITGEWNE